MATLLQKLFKPKWQHADKDIRIQAVASLNDSEVLINLASQDKNLEVRLAALKKVNAKDLLTRFFNDDDEVFRNAAIEHYLTILLGSADNERQISAIDNIDEPALLLQVATHSRNEALKEQALQRVQDQSQLKDFILSSSGAKARHTALKNISNSDMLNELIAHFKTKDKTLVRTAKEKLKQQQLEVLQEQARVEEIERILEQINTLSTSAFSPTYAGQVQHTKHQWQTVKNPDEEQVNRYQTSLAQCETLLERYKVEAEKIETQRRESELAQEMLNAANLNLKNITEELKKSCQFNLDQISESVAINQKRWQQANVQLKLDKATQQSFKDLIQPIVQLEASLLYLSSFSEKSEPLFKNIKNIQALSISEKKQAKKQIADALVSINWPDEAATHPIVESLLTGRIAVEKSLNQLLADEKNQVEKLAGQLDKFEHAIESGNIKEGKKLQTSIQHAINNLAPNKAKEYNGRLLRLNGQLQELTDWKGFAVLPKMESLCNEMEQLVNCGIDVQILADKIQVLQQSWKQLGSAGSRQDSQRLWQRFKEAADKAYEPCRQFYDDLSQQRSLNEQKRRDLCEQLEDFHQKNNWAETDWKAIEALISKAKEEFRLYSPVSRNTHRQLQEQFNNAISLLRDKLTEAYDEFANKKQALIKDVEQLLEAENTSDAIESCKNIQSQWKAIPQAGRQDFKLWKQFRSACDSLFNRRDQERTQRKVDIDQNIEKSETLIQDANNLLSTASPEQQQSKIIDIINNIEALDLPKKIAERSLKIASEVQSSLTIEIKHRQSNKTKEMWLSTIQLAESIDNETDSIDSLLEQLDTFKVSNALKSAIKLKSGHQENNHTASVDPLSLCIELEIALGLPAIDAEQTIRMAIQVERLQKKMGQGEQNRNKLSEEILARWVLLDSTQEPYQSHKERFVNGLSKA